MKMRSLLLFISVATAIPTTFNHKTPEVVEWEEWKSTFGGEWDHLLASDEMDVQRNTIYKQNVEEIISHNERHDRGEVTYRLGVNAFTHLTQKEWAKIYLRPMNFTNPLRTHVLPEDQAPTSQDWRPKGAVTPVKNQGQCGSCWAFSTTGSTEGANFIHNGKLVSLSEQQLMDCSRAEGDMSCSGGLMDNAFKYIIANHGIDTEADYPYKMHDESCNAAKEKSHAVEITGYKDVPHESGAQLEAAVALGPVSIAIEADQSSFQHYKSGTFTGPCGHNLDHGVLIVGYTPEYWIVKNSWGTVWGMDGYLNIARNLDAPYGLCGILMQPSYPTAGAPGPTAPPTTPAPTSSLPYYEDPYLAPCHAGEKNITVNGIQGAYCAPTCPSGTCPAAPAAFKGANAQCVLTNESTGEKYCGLICTGGSATACIPKMSTCKAIQGTGLCTWNDIAPQPTTKPTAPAPPTPGPTKKGPAYENPYLGACGGNEANLTLPTVPGAICAPSCTASSCAEAPPGGFSDMTTPICDWVDPYTEEKFCTLQCNPNDPNACDSAKHATCKKVGEIFNRTVGMCTYNNVRSTHGLTTLFDL